MEYNEELVEETTENVEEQPTEEVVESVELTDTSDTEEVEETKEEPKGRFITEEEINRIVDRRVRKKMEKHEKNMSAYRDTEEVLKTALNVNDINEANERLRDYYTQEGITLPEKIKSGLSTREIEVLAKDDAEQIIEEGYDAMVEEANRLAAKEYKNLNDREKVIFDTLAFKLTQENDKKELLSLGVNEDILKNEDFIQFRNQFNTNTKLKDIYSLYKKTQPKKDIETPGSMKNNNATKPLKRVYTDEEISKLTLEDLDDPEVWEAVRNSMTN